jgi:hypothetical protein
VFGTIGIANLLHHTLSSLQADSANIGTHGTLVINRTKFRSAKGRLKLQTLKGSD